MYVLADLQLSRIGLGGAGEIRRILVEPPESFNPLRTITIGRTEFSNFLWRRSGEYSKIIRKRFTEIGFLLFEL